LSYGSKLIAFRSRLVVSARMPIGWSQYKLVQTGVSTGITIRTATIPNDCGMEMSALRGNLGVPIRPDLSMATSE